MKNALRVVVAIAMVALFGLGLAGCSNDGGNANNAGTTVTDRIANASAPSTAPNTTASEYSVTYKVVPLFVTYEGEERGAGLDVTVSGPLATLIVTITDPSGRARTKLVQKENLALRGRIIQLSLWTTIEPQTGTWVLELKTLDTEKVVLRKEITLPLPETAAQGR